MPEVVSSRAAVLAVLAGAEQDRERAAPAADPAQTMDGCRAGEDEQQDEGEQQSEETQDSQEAQEQESSEEQRGALADVQALMSVLEGHGNAVMNRLGAQLVDGQARMARVLQARRTARGARRSRPTDRMRASRRIQGFWKLDSTNSSSP